MQYLSWPGSLLHFLGLIVGLGVGVAVFVGRGVAVSVLVGCGVLVGSRFVGVGVADGPGVSVLIGVNVRSGVGVSVLVGELVEVGFKGGESVRDDIEVGWGWSADVSAVGTGDDLSLPPGTAA